MIGGRHQQNGAETLGESRKKNGLLKILFARPNIK